MKPHTAIAATDESLLSGPAFTSTLLVAECTSEHPAGRWTYVVAMHANPGDEPISGEIRLDIVVRDPRTPPGQIRVVARSGPADLVAWNWRKGTARAAGTRRHRFPCRSAGKAGLSTCSLPSSVQVWR